MIKHNIIKYVSAHFLLLVTCLYPAISFSELVGDLHWRVEKGDNTYSIARKIFPDDIGKQRQFRRELVQKNPSVFKGNASQMGVGNNLVLPAFAVSNPVSVVPVVIKKVPLEEQIPVVSDIEQPLAVEEPVIVEERITTPDPQDVIGHVVVSVGKMQANNRGVFRNLLRRSEILTGDTLITSKAAYTQIRMKDGALISLRPNTRLKITDYRYNGKEDGSERSIMELLSGGFRTITGYIGHRNKRNYRVKTAVATIGIRGTHYGLMVCAEGSCNDESVALEDGIYGGVVDGSIVVNNEAGQSTFNNDQYFYVASLQEPAVEQLVPPPVFHGKAEKAQLSSKTDKRTLRLEQRKKVRGDRLGALVKSYIEDRRPRLIPADKTDPNSDKPATTFAPNGSTMLIAFTPVDTELGTVDTTAAAIPVGLANNAIILGNKVESNGMVISNLPISVHENAGGDVHNLVLPSGASGIADIGGNSFGVNWGRWSDNYVFTENGAVVQTVGDLHFIFSNNVTKPAELAQLAALGGLTTSESYTLLGNTTPTNAAGQAVSLVQLNVVSDFVNQRIVSYQVGVQDQGANFAMQANDILFQNMAEFDLTETSCSVGCTGHASAAFVGSQAQGLMTTYSIQETGGGPKGASGAAFLGRDSAAAVQ